MIKKILQTPSALFDLKSKTKQSKKSQMGQRMGYNHGCASLQTCGVPGARYEGYPASQRPNT